MLDIITAGFEQTLFISHCTNYLCVSIYKVTVCHLNVPTLHDVEWVLSNGTRQIGERNSTGCGQHVRDLH